MAETNEDVMSEQDIELLVNGFPDLKNEKDFPKDPTSASVVDFVSGYMKKLGVEGRPSEMLEYLATSVAMKSVAQASLGKFDGYAYKQMNLDSDCKKAFSNVFTRDLNDGEPVVHRDVLQSLSGIDFKTVAAMFPMQRFLRENMSKEMQKLDMCSLDSKSFEKFGAIPQFAGNESGAFDLKQEDFTITARARVATSDSVLNGYSSMYLLSNALQIRAALDLGEQFPQMGDAIKKNKEFFMNHAPETIAVCHALRDEKLDVNSVENLKEMISDPKTRDFAYKNYVNVFPSYVFLADAEKGKCSLTYGERKEDGDIKLPRRVYLAENGVNFIEKIQDRVEEQAPKTSGRGAKNPWVEYDLNDLFM